MANFSSEYKGDFGVPRVEIKPIFKEYDPYSGIDLTGVDYTETNFNTEEYYSLDSDGRPSLGIVATIESFNASIFAFWSLSLFAHSTPK